MGLKFLLFCLDHLWSFTYCTPVHTKSWAKNLMPGVSLSHHLSCKAKLCTQLSVHGLETKTLLLSSSSGILWCVGGGGGCVLYHSPPPPSPSARYPHGRKGRGGEAPDPRGWFFCIIDLRPRFPGAPGLHHTAAASCLGCILPPILPKTSTVYSTGWLCYILPRTSTGYSTRRLCYILPRTPIRRYILQGDSVVSFPGPLQYSILQGDSVTSFLGPLQYILQGNSVLSFPGPLQYTVYILQGDSVTSFPGPLWSILYYRVTL